MHLDICNLDSSEMFISFSPLAEFFFLLYTLHELPVYTFKLLNITINMSMMMYVKFISHNLQVSPHENSLYLLPSLHLCDATLYNYRMKQSLLNILTTCLFCLSSQHTNNGYVAPYYVKSSDVCII